MTIKGEVSPKHKLSLGLGGDTMIQATDADYDYVHVTWMLSVMILAAGWSLYSQIGGKMPLVPLSAVTASQARPQETGLSALWAKMVTKVLFKLHSSGL